MADVLTMQMVLDTYNLLKGNDDMQKQKQYGSGDDDSTAVFQIPRPMTPVDTTKLLQKAHQEQEEDEKKNGKQRPKRRGGVICCCEDPNCRIGPMRARPDQDAQ